MKPIKEFIEEAKYDLKLQVDDYGNQWHNRQYYLTDWNRKLEDGGYYQVDILSKNFAERQKAVAWCTEQFGKDHYCWTGSSFWFECEQDSVLFTLRWL